MPNTNSHKIGFYILIAATVAIGWIAASGVALYIRGTQLLTLQPEERARQEHSWDKNDAGANGSAAQLVDTPLARYPIRKAPFSTIHPPALLHRSASTQDIPQPTAISARAAVVIDAASGALLFEKNPDQSIPPASLTKLVAIYTAMQAVERGKVNLTDTITPPAASWAVTIPSGSSLMFLGKNQRVTVEELMRGMAVVSGNDAAVALAIHTAGSVKAFVQQMNEVVSALGLHNTHFEDANGLSEYNRTTARDFARFCAVYVRQYPDHLARFHSLRELSYPQPHNMLKPQTTIHQPATNTLLAKLDGCDGIKTGFIYESGFNIALTAQRNGIRFIAVILGGAGKNMEEGKTLREENGKILMEWAFTHFSTRYAQNFPLDMPAIPVVGAQEPARQTALQPQLDDPSGNNGAFTVPLSGTELNGSDRTAAEIHARILAPHALAAPIAAGEKIGTVQFFTEREGQQLLLAEFPLIANKTLKKGSVLRWKYDNLALKLYRFLHRR